MKRALPKRLVAWKVWWIAHSDDSWTEPYASLIEWAAFTAFTDAYKAGYRAGKRAKGKGKA